MSERPPAERALFDRVMKSLDQSKAKTPGAPEDVAALSDLDAALSLCVVLAADIDHMTNGTRDLKYCGHCRAHDEKTAQIFETVEEVQRHILKCPHNPLVRAAHTALAALDAKAVVDSIHDHWTDEMQLAYDTALETLRRMVGR